MPFHGYFCFEVIWRATHWLDRQYAARYKLSVPTGVFAPANANQGSKQVAAAHET
jgi:hypothetical protein